MSSFRDFVPQALEILQGAHDLGEATDGIPEEMRAHAGFGALTEGWGDIPMGAPTGPMPLQQSPRRPQPKDPFDDEEAAREARQARRSHIQQWQQEDSRAILRDPRVGSALGTIHRLLQDMDHTLREQQNSLNNARLQASHLLGQAARDPGQAAQLKQHIPQLLAVLQAIGAGEPSAEFRDRIAAALVELEGGTQTTSSTGSASVLTFLGL